MNSTVTPLPAGQKRKRGGGCLSGCLIGALAFVLLTVGVGWWFLGKPVRAFTTAIRDLGQIEKIDRQIANRSGYTPPSDGELSTRQVESYVNVLGGIHADLKNRVDVLAEKYEQLGGKQPSLVDIPRFAEAYADVIGLLGEARAAQVQALNSQNLSLAEYQWIRGQVLTASGLVGEAADFSSVLGALSGGSTTPVQAGTFHVANRELLERYSDELQEYGALTILGF